MGKTNDIQAQDEQVELTRELKALHVQIENATETLSQVNTDIDTARTVLRQLETDIVSAQNKITTLEKIIGDYEVRKIELEAELDVKHESLKK